MKKRQSAQGFTRVKRSFSSISPAEKAGIFLFLPRFCHDFAMILPFFPKTVKKRVYFLVNISYTYIVKRHQTTFKEGDSMTMKERLEVHRQIEAENKRKLKEWKEGKAA